MAIEVVQKDFSGYRGMGRPASVEVPVLLPGDRVELSGWQNPVVGEVLEVGRSLIWVKVPVAIPGGGPHVCSVLTVQKVWREDSVWEAPNAA